MFLEQLNTAKLKNKILMIFIFWEFPSPQMSSEKSATTREPRCQGSSLRVKKNRQKHEKVCDFQFFSSSNGCFSKAYTEKTKK